MIVVPLLPDGSRIVFLLFAVVPEGALDQLDRLHGHATSNSFARSGNTRDEAGLVASTGRLPVKTANAAAYLLRNRLRTSANAQEVCFWGDRSFNEAVPGVRIPDDWSNRATKGSDARRRPRRFY
jgi:hypothetical protein